MKISAVAVAVALAMPAFGAISLLEQGRDALNQNDVDRAVTLLEQAVAQNPNSSEAHLLLADAYGTKARTASMFSQLGLANRTKDELNRALALDPNNAEARFALVQFYTEAPGIAGGSDAKAAEQANALRQRDTLYGHRAWAYIYGHQKKPELARKEYTDWVRDQPNLPVAHYWLGVQHLIDKNNTAALGEFETSIKLDPNYMPGWFQIGHLAALNGNDCTRGEAALRKYLAYKPKHEEPPVARAHYWIGVMYEKQGRKAEARQSFETSLRLNANQRDVQEALKRVS